MDKQQAYGFPVNHWSTDPAASAPPPTAPPPPPSAAPQPMSVVNNVVVNPGLQYHPHATGYVVVETEAGPPSLPCCGIGVGWFLFIFGWFVGISWYVGAIILLCTKVDRRERAGCIGCTIMATILTIMAIIIAAKGN